ncbi:MAG: thioredoxin family protein [Chitinophagales bacterium]|nr:thioredoxin family protein [Chitinophagales bacterium]MCZ2394334.1 thioredoxin family protein [Chitinophagales bacterium]
MAATETNMIPLGFKAPLFSLIDTVSGEILSLEDLKGKVATVIMFICNHCPYVLHINPQINLLVDEFSTKGVQFIGISSNDIENYPQDAPELMTQHAKEVGYKFPYLYDESQEIAKAYFAECTPDISVFDKDLLCVYRGRLDGSTPKNQVELTGTDLREALHAIIEGRTVNPDQKASIGCNIKWKKV